MDRLLTLPEVAEMLRTSPDTLRYWRHVGTGPKSFRIGGRVVYKSADVETWIEKQYADDPSPAA